MSTPAFRCIFLWWTATLAPHAVTYRTPFQKITFFLWDSGDRGADPERRMGRHAKQHAVVEAFAQGAKSVQESIRGCGKRQDDSKTGYKWINQELAALRAAQHSFSGEGHFSYVFDGIRIGNPAVEYIFSAAGDIDGNGRLNGCFPPEVP